MKIANGEAVMTNQYQLTPEEHEVQKNGKVGTNTVWTEAWPCTAPYFMISDDPNNGPSGGDHLCLVDEGNSGVYPTVLDLGSYCLVGSNCSLGTWAAHIRAYRAGYMGTSSRAHPLNGTTDCDTNGINHFAGDVNSFGVTSCEQAANKFKFVDVIQ